MTKTNTRDLALIALFTTLIIVGAKLTIPLPLIPITMQTFFIMLGAVLLGKKRATIAVAVYIFMGLVGLPVFSAGGGFAYAIKPSFGYIYGFIATTLIIGFMLDKIAKPSFWQVLLACFLGTLGCYAVALVHMYCINTFLTGTTVGLWAMVYGGAIVFLPGDIVKCIVVAVAGARLYMLRK